MAHGYPGTPGIHSPAQVAGWKRVTDTVHARGGRIFLQLWHVGRISHPSLLPNDALPVAPSAIKPAGKAFTHQGTSDFVTPRALETSEIPALIESFRIAAHYAETAGFDGVEVHGANGYLLDQFLHDGSNHRSDQYGGSITKRRANAAIAASRADCVAFGQSYIANPDPVERYAQDAPLNVPNASTFYGGRELGYTDYPALTGDHVAPLRLPAALSLRRCSSVAPLSQLGPIPPWREPA